MDRRDFKFIGELPSGDWRFCLVTVKGQPDVIVVADMTGQNPPRMVIGDKLVEVEC